MWSDQLLSARGDEQAQSNGPVDQAERTSAPAASSRTGGGYLNVTGVDLRIAHNAAAHRTDAYSLTTSRNPKRARLVVRRGQPFALSIDFDRLVHWGSDEVELVLSLGSAASVSKGTKVVLPLAPTADAKPKAKCGWRCAVTEEVPKPAGGQTVRLELAAAATAPIGAWHLDINTTAVDSGGYRVESGIRWTSIYLLFNPWHNGDAVHMEHADDLDEYVLNESGKIWKGTHNQPQVCAWCYGQFDDGVLEAALLVLERSGVPCAQRGDPVRLSRAMVRMANSPDDKGVLQGKWSPPFSYGTPPTAWTGSAAILRAYASSSGRRPVRYGQCWIFAGVVCTLMRALGIPCRVVTNYSSAHDTDGSCTVDLHFDKATGDVIKDMAADSVWNFHVWNDVWMRRADLPPGNDGWQVVDATPQERSSASGKYEVGPASVSAVRRGAVGLQYDTAFVFAECNADKVYWLVDTNTGKSTYLKSASDEVGRMMISKRPCSRKAPADQVDGVANGEHDSDDDGEDIRHVYKHVEGSAAERTALFNALLLGRADLLQYYEGVQSQTINEKPEKVAFELDLAEQCDLGSDLKATVLIKNQDKVSHCIKLVLQVYAAEYTGASGNKLFDQFHQLAVNAKSEQRVSACVPSGVYASALTQACAFKVSAMAVVVDTGYVFTVEDECRLILPSVQIDVNESTVIEWRDCGGMVSMHNPLPIALRNCTFSLEGTGLVERTTLFAPDASPSATVGVGFTMRPSKVGRRTLVARFESDQLHGIEGSRGVDVRPRQQWAAGRQEIVTRV